MSRPTGYGRTRSARLAVNLAVKTSAARPQFQPNLVDLPSCGYSSYDVLKRLLDRALDTPLRGHPLWELTPDIEVSYQPIRH